MLKATSSSPSASFLTNPLMVRLEPGYRKRQLWGQLIWFFAWAFVTGVAIYLRPDPAGHGTHMQLGLPPCPSTLFFDRPCPGCGLTTSFTATVHGDFIAGFKAHALGPILYFLFTASALACFVGWARNYRFNTDSKAFNWSLAGLLVVFFGFGFMRFAVNKDYNAKTPEPLANSSTYGYK